MLAIAPIPRLRPLLENAEPVSQARAITSSKVDMPMPHAVGLHKPDGQIAIHPEIPIRVDRPTIIIRNGLTHALIPARGVHLIFPIRPLERGIETLVGRRGMLTAHVV